jgi:GTP-binding protein
LPVVAIVGRPNVGKSTLFNRLVGEKRAVVHDRPGVTRDRLYEETELVDRQILLIDTGGIEPAPETPLLEAMRRQAMVAVEEADVIIFVVDGRLGLTPADDEVADILRRSGKAVVLAVNKVDGHTLDDLANEFWSLGVQPMHTVSAAHGGGIYELLDVV